MTARDLITALRMADPDADVVLPDLQPITGAHVGSTRVVLSDAPDEDNSWRAGPRRALRWNLVILLALGAAVAFDGGYVRVGATGLVVAMALAVVGVLRGW